MKYAKCEVFSQKNQSLFLTLELPNIIAKKDFLEVIASNEDSKLVIKLKKSFSY